MEEKKSWLSKEVREEKFYMGRARDEYAINSLYEFLKNLSKYNKNNKNKVI